MSTLPIELWAQIASTNIQTYHIVAQVVGSLHKVRPVGATSWEDYFTVVKVNEYGSQLWRLHGKLHRGSDMPAVIFADGGRAWYQHGKLHRCDDKPAVIYVDGGQEWWWRGKLHRDDGKPAVVSSSGHCAWWCRGKLLRLQ